MNFGLCLTCLFLSMMLAPVFGQQADLIFLKYAKDGDASGMVGAIQMGAHVNVRDADGRTALMLTAMVNDWPHLDSLQTLMGWKPDLDLVDHKGYTALMYATEAKHQKAVQLLLERGANPDLKPRTVKGGEVSEKKGLLSSLTGLFSKDKGTASATSTSSVTSKSSAGSAKPGAPLGPSKIEIITEETPRASTPVSVMSASSPTVVSQNTSPSVSTRTDTTLIDVVKSGDIIKVRAMLTGNTPINEQDTHGWSALMYAVSAGQADIAQVLLEHGANLNIKDRGGWDPLLLAANQGNPVIVQALLSGGANVNVRTVKDTTPLIIASGKGHLGVVQSLITAGAILDVKDYDGKTALMYAAKNQHTMIVELLQKSGARE